jgi:hypothetical protein
VILESEIDYFEREPLRMTTKPKFKDFDTEEQATEYALSRINGYHQALCPLSNHPQSDGLCKFNCVCYAAAKIVPLPKTMAYDGKGWRYYSDYCDNAMFIGYRYTD